MRVERSASVARSPEPRTRSPQEERASGGSSEARAAEADSYRAQSRQAGGPDGDLPFDVAGGGDVPQAFPGSCVPAAYAKELKAKDPAAYEKVCCDLMETGSAQVPGGGTLTLSEASRSAIENGQYEGTMGDAAFQAAVMEDAGEDPLTSPGMDLGEIERLDAKLGVSVQVTDDHPEVGRYMMVGEGDQRHFMRITAVDGDSVSLEDASGNTRSLKTSELLDQAHLSDSANVGGETGFQVTNVSTSAGRGRGK